jgi:uncharacterized protein (TIRG00374 family)
LGGAGLALVLLWLVLRGIDRTAFLGALRSADTMLLAGSAATTLVLYLVRAWRWGMLLAPLGTVPYGRLFSATVIGFMSGMVIPRAGEVLRPYLVGRAHGIPVSAAFASVVLERFLDLLSVLALFALYLFVLPAPAQQIRGPLLDSLRVAGLAATAAVMGGLGLLFAFHANAERALALADRLLAPLPRRLAAAATALLRQFTEGLAIVRAPVWQLIAILGQSLLIWLAIAAGIYLNNLAFGLGLPFHSTFLMLVPLVVGVTIPTPGMVGGFHAAYVVALTQAFGVDREVAAAAGIMNHALVNLPVLVMGLYFVSFAGAAEGLTLSRVANMTETSEQRRAAAAGPRLSTERSER